MSEIAIKIEDVSKMYRLGTVGSGSLVQDVNSIIARLRGNEDPAFKIGEINDRTNKSKSDYVWSLKDITFDVRKGDAVGIIGRNGAGKSTLLKILSRVTSPTSGSIKIKGRVASLLEVGTGFHPELSGRDNIYMNGAIFGMGRREIRSKLDEIIDFSGCERYIDTPVKRYSSGMYVRLAFAVAAHLEPEILIVDEVLAVGDAEFQKKCLGKMQDVNSKEGRTVLFVSHNIQSISALCSQGIYLKNGQIELSGSISNVISSYFNGENKSQSGEIINKHKVKAGQKFRLNSAKIVNEKGETIHSLDKEDDAILEIKYSVFISGYGYNVGFHLYHVEHGIVFSSTSFDVNPDLIMGSRFETGDYIARIDLPLSLLREGNYYFTIGSAIPNIEMLDRFDNELFMNIFDKKLTANKTGVKRQGVILPILEWKQSRLEK